MTVVMELTERELEILEEAIGLPIEDEDDAEDSIRRLIDNCM